MDQGLLYIGIGIQLLFMILGLKMKGYVVPELISTVIGVLMIRDFSFNATIGTMLLPSWFFLLVVFLTLAPVLFIVLRLQGSDR